MKTHILISVNMEDSISAYQNDSLPTLSLILLNKLIFVFPDIFLLGKFWRILTYQSPKCATAYK